METGELRYLEAERAALPDEYGNSGKKNKKKKLMYPLEGQRRRPDF